MKKKKNMLMIFLMFIILPSTVFALSIDFWQSSQLNFLASPGSVYVVDIYQPVSEQFTEHGCGEGTVLDHQHNLCWLADGNQFGLRNPTEAENDCSSLNIGFEELDWKLPTINQLLTIVKDNGINSGTHLNDLNIGETGFINYQGSDFPWSHFYLTGTVSNETHSMAISFYNSRVNRRENGFVTCVSIYEGD